MRKVILYLQVSLDGVASDVDKWANIDEELMQDSIKRYENENSTVLFGGGSYAGMGQYWQEAEKSSTWAGEKKLAKMLNDMEKFVVSRSKKDLSWRNSKQIQFTDAESLRKELDKLKKQPGKAIAVESGLGLWHFFIENDLYDELKLVIHPVIAGKGEKLFTGEELTKLELVESKTFENGCIKVHYRKRNA